MRSASVSMVLTLVVLFLCASCESEPGAEPPTPVAGPVECVDTPMQADGTLDFLRSDGSVAASISIEIVDTPADRQRGLMWRCSMDMDKGMLFVFDRSEPRGFWMHNTFVSLDILFVDAEKRIVKMHEDTTPLSKTLLRSDRPVRFTVEVRAGFARRFDITEGTLIRWSRR